MDVDGQICVLRNRYLGEIKRIYDRRFQMKLMSVIAFHRKQYEEDLKSIELISSIIEGAVTGCNPKRMLRYIIVLQKVIDDLVFQIEKDYKDFWERKLTQ